MYSHFLCESLDTSSADNNPIVTLMISSSISWQGDHSLRRFRPNISAGSTGLSSISSTTLSSPVQINTCHSLVCFCKALCCHSRLCARPHAADKITPNQQQQAERLATLCSCGSHLMLQYHATSRPGTSVALQLSQLLDHGKTFCKACLAA